MAALVRGQADAANQGAGIPCEGREGEAAGGHAQVEDGGTGRPGLAKVHGLWDGEGRRGEIEFEADAPHELEEACLDLVVRVVGAGPLVLEPSVPGGIFPALGLEVSSASRNGGSRGGHRLTCPFSEVSSW